MAAILIIDDDAMVRQILVTALTLAGHTVVDVDNANEALRLIELSAPDLIMTDIVMPEKDGIEVLAELRRRSLAIPVIAMSGNSSFSPLYLRTAKQLGAVRLLGKPFNEGKLMQTVREALQAGAGQVPGQPSSNFASPVGVAVEGSSDSRARALAPE